MSLDCGLEELRLLKYQANKEIYIFNPIPSQFQWHLSQKQKCTQTNNNQKKKNLGLLYKTKVDPKEVNASWTREER